MRSLIRLEIPSHPNTSLKQEGLQLAETSFRDCQHVRYKRFPHKPGFTKTLYISFCPTILLFLLIHGSICFARMDGALSVAPHRVRYKMQSVHGSFQNNVRQSQIANFVGSRENEGPVRARKTQGPGKRPDLCEVFDAGSWQPFYNAHVSTMIGFPKFVPTSRTSESCNAQIPKFVYYTVDSETRKNARYFCHLWVSGMGGHFGS